MEHKLTQLIHRLHYSMAELGPPRVELQKMLEEVTAEATRLLEEVALRIEKDAVRIENLQRENGELRFALDEMEDELRWTREKIR